MKSAQSIRKLGASFCQMGDREIDSQRPKTDKTDPPSTLVMMALMIKTTTQPITTVTRVSVVSRSRAS